MDEMRSSEFRKRYAALTAPTVVTVNGHVIGEWVPVTHSRYVTVQEAKAAIASVRASADQVVAESRGVEFRPVPKPIRKAKATR